MSGPLRRVLFLTNQHSIFASAQRTVIVNISNFHRNHHSRRYSSATQEQQHSRSRYPGLRWLFPVLSAVAVCVGYNWQTECSSKEKTSTTREDDQEKVSVSEEVPKKDKNKNQWDEAIVISKDLCRRIKDETACPGLAVAVFIDGKEVWSDGLGYADVENRVPCQPDSVMRIASISKPIAATLIAKLWEEGRLDIDKPIQEYVPTWPQKTFKGEKVTITTRQLLSHMAGIRHYEKNCGKKNSKKPKKETKKTDSINDGQDKDKRQLPDNLEKEFYNKNKYNTVTDALGIFKEDELCSVPGTEFLYTTYGWTLLSAVAEGAAKKTFPALMKGLLLDLGMDNTYLDENEPLIYSRARNYEKNKKGRLINAPYVDNSCKWAGGGLLSTVQDVSRFGSAMLYAYQHRSTNSSSSQTPGYLKGDTVRMLWKPVILPEHAWQPDLYYGMGWDVMELDGKKHGGCREMARFYSHTGGAVGCSSVLIVMPRDKAVSGGKDTLPKGVVVTLIANMTGVGLARCALKIAKSFGEAALANESN